MDNKHDRALIVAILAFCCSIGHAAWDEWGDRQISSEIRAVAEKIDAAAMAKDLREAAEELRRVADELEN